MKRTFAVLLALALLVPTLCTANCITISRAEAKRRGGVPCKRCGGSC